MTDHPKPGTKADRAGKYFIAPRGTPADAEAANINHNAFDTEEAARGTLRSLREAGVLEGEWVIEQYK